MLSSLHPELPKELYTQRNIYFVDPQILGGLGGLISSIHDIVCSVPQPFKVHHDTKWGFRKSAIRFWGPRMKDCNILGDYTPMYGNPYMGTT